MENPYNGRNDFRVVDLNGTTPSIATAGSEPVLPVVQAPNEDRMQAQRYKFYEQLATRYLATEDRFGFRDLIRNKLGEDRLTIMLEHAEWKLEQEKAGTQHIKRPK